MISPKSLSKIKEAYKIWLNENEDNFFYHPDLVEELIKNDKSIHEFDEFITKHRKIVNYRSFFTAWLKGEIDDLNLHVLDEQFELGQHYEFVKSVFRNTKETKSVLKSGERIELTAYGDSKLQNREVVAYTFKFTDNLLSSYDDSSEKANNYFKRSDNALELLLNGKFLIDFLKTNNMLDLISDQRILRELTITFRGSDLILYLKSNELLHLVTTDEIFEIIKKENKGLKFLKFIEGNGFDADCPVGFKELAIGEFFSELNLEIEKLKKQINTSTYYATDRATLLLKENQLHFNKEFSKSKFQTYSVPGEYNVKFFAIDEYLNLFQDYFNRHKFTQDKLTKEGFKADLVTKNLNEQALISNKIQELFSLNESRALEQGANSSGPSGGWYAKKWLVYLLLVLFFPLGLYGLAKNKSISGITKFVIFGIFGFLIYGAYKGDATKAFNNSVVTPSNAFQIDTTMGPSFIFTNKVKDTLVVAYGYKYKKGWRSIGWYQIKPDSSLQLPIPDDLTKDALYWYAESTQGQKWVGKDKKFCVDPQNAFDIKKKKMAKCQETAVFTKRLLSQTYNTIEIQ